MNIYTKHPKKKRKKPSRICHLVLSPSPSPSHGQVVVAATYHHRGGAGGRGHAIQRRHLIGAAIPVPEEGRTRRSGREKRPCTTGGVGKDRRRSHRSRAR